MERAARHAEDTVDGRTAELYALRKVGVTKQVYTPHAPPLESLCSNSLVAIPPTHLAPFESHQALCCAHEAVF